MHNFKRRSINDFYFYNKPIYYNIKEYNKVLKKIKSKYSSNNLRSICRFGAISSPGLSDIDIIIVLKNKTNGVKKILLDKKERYIMGHPFFIIDKDIMKDIRFIYPDLHLKLVKGENILINTLNKKLIDFVNIFLSVDIAIRHFPRDYLEMLLSKRINIRDSLLRLNSLRLSLNLYKKITGKAAPDFESYKKKIVFLRKNWFNLKENDRNLKLLNLLDEAIAMSLRFIDRLRNHIIKKGIVKVDFCDKDIVYTGMRNRAFFINNWQAEKAIKLMINFYKDYGKFYSYLPLEFAVLLIEYSKNKGVLSRYIKRKLEIGKIKYKIKGKEVIDRRISLLDKQAEIALNTKHSHFVAFFDYGFKSKHGFLNMVFHALRKIKDSKIYIKTSAYSGWVN